ncbi:Peptidoglycan/LPS O-acetylase OafA/YrhL, contains acyltransferase and SGNH-hydrolase domains [Allokutzneria albata]|uniref:Peptidoglycan/LPS O-acetylase OafA/YrhL, contains acyltransferase and SGNH-hydrolase domains n=1 Tax=Allokutzneria albata TaxID=211114 RepID=A0A1G9UNN9_ALLAB|nr:Peptidoglycan/LPS O-acetylase OafA/YrhL, contains acyltransferase and SGNH-hydrolase domains [Allokutzneria albata]
MDIRDGDEAIVRQPGDAGTTGPARLPSLTGIRIFAAGLVLVAHAFFLPGLYADAAVQKGTSALVPLATSSVTLFFVLSGLVLTWSARPADTAVRFWRRRFVRIFSNHAVAWALGSALVIGYGIHVNLVSLGDDYSPLALLGNLFLVQNWVPSKEFLLGPNPLAWSLACEFFFYLLFPFLLPLVRRIPVHKLRFAAGVLVLVGLSVPVLALLLQGPDFLPTVPVPSDQIWLAYFLPAARLPEFVLGMVLARILAEGLWRPLRTGVILPLPFLAIGTLAVLPPVFAFGPYFALPVALIVGEVASRDVRGVPSFLRRPAMIYLGDRSFALYMIHYVVIMYLCRFVFTPGATFSVPVATALILLVVIPVSLGAAWLLHRSVERPAVRRLAG